MNFFFTFSLRERKFNEESRRDTRIRNEGKRKIRKKKKETGE